MATRSRRPANTSTESPKLPEAQQTPTESTNTTHEDVPDIRLVGSLHPLPSREERIAIAAYWRAAKRQFEPGHELDDWLEAEREIEGDHGREERAR